MATYKDVVWNKGEEILGTKKLSIMAENDEFLNDLTEVVPKGLIFTVTGLGGSIPVGLNVTTTPISLYNSNVYLQDQDRFYRIVLNSTGFSGAIDPNQWLTYSFLIDSTVVYQISTSEGFGIWQQVHPVYLNFLIALDAGDHTFELHVVATTSTWMYVWPTQIQMYDAGPYIAES